MRFIVGYILLCVTFILYMLWQAKRAPIRNDWDDEHGHPRKESKPTEPRKGDIRKR